MNTFYYKKRLRFALWVPLMILTGMCYNTIACTCDYSGGRQSISERVANARERSIGVFIGTVIEEIPYSENSYFTRYKFKVIQAWKGVDSAEVTVYTGTNGTLCGFPFAIGGTYLVYAFGTRVTDMGTNMCMRTTAIDENTEDLKFLGEPKFTWSETVDKLSGASGYTRRWMSHNRFVTVTETQRVNVKSCVWADSGGDPLRAFL